MSQLEAKTLTVDPVRVLDEDSRPGVARDADEDLEHWLNVSEASQIETAQPNKSDVTSPAHRREITFEGTLRINGYAAGIIRSEAGRLIVDAAGEIDANISVHDATIYGCVRGDIRAKQKVELAGSARVVGDIEAVALLIEPGAVFQGRCLFVEESNSDSSTTPDSAGTS